MLVRSENRLMVLVVSMVLCGSKEEEGESSGCCQQNFIMILTDLSVVNRIEENHRSNHDLEVRSDSNAFRLNVLVLPSPEASAQSAHECSRGLVATTQPFGNFSNLHLIERSVS